MLSNDDFAMAKASGYSKPPWPTVRGWGRRVEPLVGHREPRVHARLMAASIR